MDIFGFTLCYVKRKKEKKEHFLSCEVNGKVTWGKNGNKFLETMQQTQKNTVNEKQKILRGPLTSTIGSPAPGVC